jgi:hypothetical protein
MVEISSIFFFLWFWRWPNPTRFGRRTPKSADIQDKDFWYIIEDGWNFIEQDENILFHPFVFCKGDLVGCASRVDKNNFIKILSILFFFSVIGFKRQFQLFLYYVTTAKKNGKRGKTFPAAYELRRLFSKKKKCSASTIKPKPHFSLPPLPRCTRYPPSFILNDIFVHSFYTLYKEKGHFRKERSNST